MWCAQHCGIGNEERRDAQPFDYFPPFIMPSLEIEMKVESKFHIQRWVSGSE